MSNVGTYIEMQHSMERLSKQGPPPEEDQKIKDITFDMTVSVLETFSDYFENGVVCSKATHSRYWIVYSYSKDGKGFLTIDIRRTIEGKNLVSVTSNGYGVEIDCTYANWTMLIQQLIALHIWEVTKNESH